MRKTRLLLLLVLLMTAVTGAWAQDPTTYKVTIKEGTKDASSWTVNPTTATTTGVAAGTAVTVKYNGRLKVKSVTATTDAAPAVNIIDLSKLTANYTLQNGDVVKGTLAGNYKISIAAGATVTLDGATINGVNYGSYKWAGLNCLGNATIILKDGSVNTVKGFYTDYPGIHVPEGKKLTIKGGTEGTGKLTASPFDGGGTADSYGAGIGGGYNILGGDISIEGGTVTATGGLVAAGIGTGANSECGNITITGGTVTANGGGLSPGIGSGDAASCGDITIASSVTKVTATKGPDAPFSIGAGEEGSCGTVTIGGTKYWENNAAVGDGATYLAQDQIVYQP